ncbi:MAG: hypothetical protein IV107_00510 [Paucibacter sp.]|nr:hypothetical protein [Roseateles sp.]
MKTDRLLRLAVLSGALLGTMTITTTVRAVPVFTTFESAGANAAAITATRDAFRAAVGGGSVAGANGSFGGLRREINWDGVPAGSADPNALAADFSMSIRRAVWSSARLARASWSAPMAAGPRRPCSVLAMTFRPSVPKSCLPRPAATSPM